MKLEGRRLGQANPWGKKIELSEKTLASFLLFNLILKHEICHILDWIERGKTFKSENGRNNFHGKSFRAICKKVGIPYQSKIPSHWF